MGRLKSAFATSLVICAFGIYTMLYESALLLPSERELFFILRGTSIAIIFISAIYFLVSKTEISNLGNVFYALGVNAYSLISSVYRPWYLLSVFQFALLFAFLVPHRRRFFAIYTIVSYAVFILFFIDRWPNVPENYTQLTLEDWNNVGMQFFAMAAFVYYFFVRSGRYRARSEMRLVSIGRNASRIMMDLNNMTQHPRAELLQVETIVSGGRVHPITEVLSLTRNQLGHIQTTMLELSRLTSSAHPDVCAFSLRERIESLALTFSPPGKTRLQTEVTGDLSVFADQTQVTSLIFNLMSNSARAFEQNATNAPILTWTLSTSPPKLRCEDNGGGFSPKALVQLRSGNSYSSFSGGSGMGFQIMRECVSRLGGSLDFGNSGDGAWVEWTIPSERVLQ